MLSNSGVPFDIQQNLSNHVHVLAFFNGQIFVLKVTHLTLEPAVVVAALLDGVHDFIQTDCFAGILVYEFEHALQFVIDQLLLDFHSTYFEFTEFDSVAVVDVDIGEEFVLEPLGLSGVVLAHEVVEEFVFRDATVPISVYNLEEPPALQHAFLVELLLAHLKLDESAQPVAELYVHQLLQKLFVFQLFTDYEIL